MPCRLKGTEKSESVAFGSGGFVWSEETSEAVRFGRELFMLSGSRFDGSGNKSTLLVPAAL